MTTTAARKNEIEVNTHAGSVASSEPGLTDWILRQFAGGERVERFEVVPVFNRGKVTGRVIDHELVSPTRELGTEEATRLTNRLLESAILDCTRVQQRPTTYYVCAYASSRSAEPVANYPLHIKPRLTALTLQDPGAGGSAADLDDDESGIATAQRQMLVYVDRMIDAGQFDKQHYASTFGQLFEVMSGHIQRQESWIGTLMSHVGSLMDQNKAMFGEAMGAMREREAALSTAAERELTREWAKLKVEMLKDGARMGRNVLTTLFSKFAPRGNLGEGDRGGGAMVPAGAGSGTKSDEQMLIENFFHDAKTAKIDSALFGEYKAGENGGPPVQVQPGIFTIDQLGILMGVYKGSLSADALDDLLMDSGKPTAITMEQIAQAEQVPGMTQAIAMSMLSLVELRTERRDEARAAASAPRAPHTATPPASRPASRPTPVEPAADESDAV